MMKYRWHTKTYFCLLSLLMFLSIWENVHDRSMFYDVLCVVICSIVNTTLLFRFYVFLTVQIKLPYACTILRSRARLYCHISLLVKLDELHLFCVYLSSNKYFFLLRWFKMSQVNVIFVPITIALPARESLQYSNEHSDKYYWGSFRYNMLSNVFFILITICILYSIIYKICYFK